MRYVDIKITQGMVDAAIEAEPSVRVNRTVASPIDTLTGLIGEFAFSEWFFGDWKAHNPLDTKGRPDFLNRIEIKSSTFKYRDTLNLLVREDYAANRKPDAYVQVIIDTPIAKPNTIEAGWVARISGWATAKEVDASPLRDFGSRDGGLGGYRCHHIAIRHLRPMSSFPSFRSAT